MENIPGACLFLLSIPGTVLVVRKTIYISEASSSRFCQNRFAQPRQRWHWFVLEEHCLCEPIFGNAQEFVRIPPFTTLEQWFKVWTGCDKKNDRNNHEKELQNYESETPSSSNKSSKSVAPCGSKNWLLIESPTKQPCRPCGKAVLASNAEERPQRLWWSLCLGSVWWGPWFLVVSVWVRLGSRFWLFQFVKFFCAKTFLFGVCNLLFSCRWLSFQQGGLPAFGRGGLHQHLPGLSRRRQGTTGGEVKQFKSEPRSMQRSNFKQIKGYKRAIQKMCSEP